MSKVIADSSKIEATSKALLRYCQASSKMIKSFGGQAIFAGGDDLLFFAPVMSRDGSETIFDLCEKIAQDFESSIASEATLSFGITINYIKFPLYEAVQNSRAMLFEKAKSGLKNNIAFKVTKHSGQSFESVIHKNTLAYTNFLQLTSEMTHHSDDANFLHSLHHKIDTYADLLTQIASSKERLENFFENYFNLISF